MRKNKEDSMCKLCLFYDGCDDRFIGGCFTPVTNDDREAESIIELNRILYREEYFKYWEYVLD